MPDPTATERQQRWREFQAKRLAPTMRVTCNACGIVHAGAHGLPCPKCWDLLISKTRKALDAIAALSQEFNDYGDDYGAATRE